MTPQAQAHVSPPIVGLANLVGHTFQSAPFGAFFFVWVGACFFSEFKDTIFVGNREVEMFLFPRRALSISLGVESY
jgi:hypothetical protein